MAWIEVHDTLREHRKTYALAEALKIPHFAAGGLLVFLWTWAINNAQDGDLSSFPDSAIARACFWPKAASILIDALTACGWLSEQRMIHDWDLYAGKLIEQREIQREQSRVRQQKRREKICGMLPGLENVTSRVSHDAVTRDKMRDSRVNNEITVPNLTVPNHTIVPPLPPRGERDAYPTEVRKKSGGSPLDTMFNAFWSAYPKKIAKEVALKAFLKIKPDGETMDLILAKLEAYKRSPQWTKDGGEYIPNASTWLNQKRWEDEIPEPAAKQNGGKRIHFQEYDQRNDCEPNELYAGPDLIAEARKLREQNAAAQ